MVFLCSAFESNSQDWTKIRNLEIFVGYREGNTSLVGPNLCALDHEFLWVALFETVALLVVAFLTNRGEVAMPVLTIA